jgi:hypothetical protein
MTARVALEVLPTTPERIDWASTKNRLSSPWKSHTAKVQPNTHNHHETWRSFILREAADINANQLQNICANGSLTQVIWKPETSHQTADGLRSQATCKAMNYNMQKPVPPFAIRKLPTPNPQEHTQTESIQKIWWSHTAMGSPQHHGSLAMKQADRTLCLPNALPPDDPSHCRKPTDYHGPNIHRPSYNHNNGATSQDTETEVSEVSHHNSKK